MSEQLGLMDIRGNGKDAPLTAIDMFSGPGGFGLGLCSSGFRILAAIERVKSCVDTYRRNHPSAVVIQKDIREVKDDEIVSVIKDRTRTGTVDLVAGGPPCETFTTAGPGTRNTRDHRDHLFLELIRIAKAVKAKYVLIENVPGLMTKKDESGNKAGIFKHILNTLIDAGFWRFDFRVLNAMNYGVPQSRERVFILATSELDLPLPFPEPTHGPGRKYPWVTVSEAIGDLPPLENAEIKEHYSSEPQNLYQKIMRVPAKEFGGGLIVPDLCVEHINGGTLTLHQSPNHRLRTIERFKMIGPGEGLKDLMTRLDEQTLSELQKQGVLPNSWYIQRNRRMLLNEPSPTVTSHCLSELLHPVQHRHITPREAARLQSFPDWYYFEGPLVLPHISPEQDKYEQIGDGVPPLLSLALGSEIARALNNGKESKVRQINVN